jgi:hypothetical protein
LRRRRHHLFLSCFCFLPTSPSPFFLCYSYNQDGDNSLLPSPSSLVVLQQKKQRYRCLLLCVWKEEDNGNVSSSSSMVVLQRRKRRW